MAIEKLNASKYLLEVEDGSPATWQGVSEETSNSLDISIAEIPATSKYNGGWAETIAGLKSGNASFEAIVDQGTTVGRKNAAQLQAMALSRVIYKWRIRVDAATDEAIVFFGFMTKFTKTHEMESTAKASLTISITTEPTIVPVTA